MQVEILKRGVYLDQNQRAQQAKPGDVLEVKEWYGLSLVADGYAKVLPTPPEPKKAKPKKEKTSKQAAKFPGKNPFLD